MKKIKQILIVLGVGQAVIESQIIQKVYSPLEYLCNPMYLNPYYWKAKISNQRRRRMKTKTTKDEYNTYNEIRDRLSLFIVGILIGILIGSLLMYFIIVFNVNNALTNNGLLYNCTFWEGMKTC